MTITAKIIEDTTTLLPAQIKENTFFYDDNLYDSNKLENLKFIESYRLTTLELRYPRFIHSELMTHRVFSRNASSSRAIPVERLIQDIIDDTAMPIHWGKNQPGMKAREEHNEEIRFENKLGEKGKCSREEAWLLARDYAIGVAKLYKDAGYHKQIVNRLLEPFSHINVVVTSNQWANFLLLRDHKDAQPEIQILAREIKNALNNSAPKPLKKGEWHLPYIITQDKDEVWFRERDYLNSRSLEKIWRELAKISTARCARVSYKTHDGKPPEYEKDMELFNTLMIEEPLHASPAEHQALVTENLNDDSNFAKSNYKQHRKIIEEEKNTYRFFNQ